MERSTEEINEQNVLGDDTHEEQQGMETGYVARYKRNSSAEKEVTVFKDIIIKCNKEDAKFQYVMICQHKYDSIKDSL